MFEIQKVLLITENSEKEMQYSNNQYIYKDIILKVKGNKAYITGGDTPASKIRLAAVNTKFTANAKVLGDTWERGYGNLGFLPPVRSRILPWDFIACENGKTFAYGVKTQPNAMCFWQCDEEHIILTINIMNGRNEIQLKGRELEACEIVTAEFEGDPFDAQRSFCRMMCDNPRKMQGPVYGGNDWYCNYGANSHDSIIHMAKQIAECAAGNPVKPFMVIDDGWQIDHRFKTPTQSFYNGGPWNVCNKNFFDMGETAKAIAEQGTIPGIWFRPLLTTEKVPKEATLRGGIKDSQLDPSCPYVLDMVRRDVKTLCDWGYKLIKHDFSTYEIFGDWTFLFDDRDFIANANFTDKTKTTAEIIKTFYQVIRDSAPDDVVFIACNTISHLSAGIFEIQRTGDDTSGREWERVRKFGVNTLAFRMAQHETFYQADADCVGITDQIDWNLNRQWLDVLSKSSTPLFVSIGKDAYTDQVQRDIADAFARVCKADGISRPLDWMNTLTPEKWESSFGIDEYHW